VLSVVFHILQVKHSLCLPCCSIHPSAHQGRTLTTAWVGDSRMVLGRQSKKGWRSSWEAIDLSVDHKPTIPEERQRILDSHGRVERWAHNASARLFAWCSKLSCSTAVCATKGDAST
jgi:serine/threonine protein phosphatase PrpC